MSYLLDTNVLIAAKNLHYGFDFCPAFWEWLDAQNRKGKVHSVEKVRFEIEGREDVLADWIRGKEERFFVSPDSQTSSFFGRVTQWAYSQDYRQEARDEFFDVADFYLVAQALQGSHILVTHEHPRNSRKIIKIPDACLGLGVKFMTPFDMLRAEKARFVLGAAS
ncbi:DUF4411 family protein [bacterium]|nr:DUF4411 family protein [bacterium]